MNSLVWINKMLFYTADVVSQQGHVSGISWNGNKWKSILFQGFKMKFAIVGKN